MEKSFKKNVKVEDQSKGPSRKKGLSYVTVTSADTKLVIVNKINENAKRGINEGVEIGFIPTTPLPNVSFWVNSEENRCGMTITRENGKWGWTFENSKWLPCKYLFGSGYDMLEFDEETNKMLADRFLDCCGNKPASEQVRSVLKK